jgi:MtN3 and saliva related transmembrane protein
MHLLATIIDFIFGISLFINACLFVPQAIRIIKTKDTEGFSLVTFIGFCLTQVAAILYGIMNHDYLIIFGYILAFIACGSVTALIAFYRQPKVGTRRVSNN